MKTLQTKPWLKAIAGVLCVVSLTTAAVSFGSVQWLASRGAYQDNGYNLLMDNVEQTLLHNLVHNVYVNYESQELGYQSEIEPLLPDPNFFYTIKDKTGKTLAASEELGDYRARYSDIISVGQAGEEVTIDETYNSLQARHDAKTKIELEHPDASIELSDWGDGQYRLTATYQEGYYEENLTFTGFLRSDLRNVGNSSVYREMCRAATLWSDKDLYLAALTAGACLGALSLIYLTWAAGRRKDTDEIALGWLDRAVFSDVLIVASLVLGVFTLWILDQNVGRNSIPILAIPLLAACIALLLVWYLSLVRRLKAKVLGSNLFLWKLGKPGHWIVDRCRRAAQAIRRSGSAFLEKLPLIWQAGMLFLVSALLEIWVIFGDAISYGNGQAVLWVLLKCVEAAGIAYIVLAMRKLEDGARELAAGNLNYQVDLQNLPGAFYTHGEHLNSMRTAIQAAVEDQIKSERMKTELITNVSHDIKTPLTSIVNYVDLLKKQEMPTDEAKEYLEVLDRQAGKLKKLTEDLVEAAKASAGTMPVNFQRTDVNVLLTQSSGEYQEKLQSKNLQLLLTPAQDNPAISADGRLLWRVFENLLSNIYKYALPGTRVYLTCQATETQVTITFRNISANPLNISADELLERFVRGDDSRHTEGSGLGLSIARSLTQLQNGTFDLAIDGDLFKASLTFPRMG
ncbi:MAG: sensor histidine kinase [Bacillota bacterium]|nr:sensor histidine kinase [Bacillota bacterium]